ncbi:polymeric immunoglobulin receptor-like [Chaetodon auriga]|uniref:polymeric immunoglobulin receptor-like n=1 Tax=Chaetodon auriga TaxID=39042 RepID=UPI004032DED2
MCLYSNMKMWSLRNLLFILYIILRCVRYAAAVIHVSGYEGRQVTFSCPYENKHRSHEKYLCKHDCGDNDVLIRTTEARKNKYSIYDQKEENTFTVTISDLRNTDAGIYWCGVSVFGFDHYPTKIEVEVRPEWCCVKSVKLSGTVGRPVTMKCPYPPQHRENKKFLCKGDHRNNCTDVVKSQSRFTLQDDASLSSFLVTITEMEAGDAGTYWCGSDSQWRRADYTKIHLSVVFPQQITTVMPPISEPTSSQSTHMPGEHVKDAAPLHSVVFIVPAALLILTFALVIVYRYKCHKVQGAEVNMNRDHSKAAEAEEVMSVTDIYENHDVVVRSKQRTSKWQRTNDHYEDAGEDCVYQNLSTTEDIYCNQISTKAKR